MDKDLWSNIKKEDSKKADNVENLLSKASTVAKEKLGNITTLKTTISMDNLDTLNPENRRVANRLLPSPQLLTGWAR